MGEARKHRIVKWTLRSLATALVLLCLYVNLYWAACWVDSRGQVVLNGLPVFEPLNQYGWSELPGGLEFQTVSSWILNGRTASLSEEYEFCQWVRERKTKSAKD